MRSLLLGMMGTNAVNTAKRRAELGKSKRRETLFAGEKTRPGHADANAGQLR